MHGTLAGAGYTVNLLIDTGAKAYTLPKRTRFLLDHAFITGVRALPVTLVVALFAGAILALQTGIELQRYGQSNMIGTITALTMCREMGPFITALILAATVGSPPDPGPLPPVIRTLRSIEDELGRLALWNDPAGVYAHCLCGEDWP